MSLASDLRVERHRLGRVGQATIRAALLYTRSRHVDLRLAEAVASRESTMRNIVGDAGHGRGMFQQDDRFQQDFLRRHRGCDDGTSIPRYRSALPKGRVPTIFAGAVQMARILEANVEYAKHIGVHFGDRLHFALAAYNAGLGGAERGWREGDVDRYTTGHDYGRDVLERRKILQSL